jgi:hypothetical protein
VADPSAKLPAGAPSERGAREADASENALWLSSVGYQLAQMQRTAERHHSEVLQEARNQRPDLTDAEFAVLTDHEFPPVVPWTTTAEDVLAYVDAVRPPPTQPIREPQVASRRRLRLEVALARLAKAGRGAPTQDEIAQACRPQIIDRTLRRWLHEEPELYDLLPWLRAPRTK